jgi:hypothetical protein
MTTSMSTDELANELVRRGTLPTKGGPVPAVGDDRPWYISAVLGAAGWLASLFALMFVWLLFEPNTVAGSAFTGGVMLAAGFGLYLAGRESAFFDQLALALSLAGQLSLVWAAAQATESAAATAGLAAVLETALVLTLPNRFAKALAAFFACVAWALTVRFAWWGETVFGDEPTTVAVLPALLGWFVIWIPVVGIVQALIAREAQWMARSWRRIARPALTGLLVGLAVATWVSEPLGSLQFWAPSSAAHANWLVLWPLLAVATALFAATCAFRLRHHALLGVAIAGALLHVMQFYYVLGTTLVVKSYIMLVVGGVLLIAARLARQRASSARSASQ